ncbi:hypothetical protein BU25DRAFT_425656 [Macroventuria anomochaeta]|uniref:Uncharacterized protein n=1 Tax=Macroventuria anomochaeta TaxID=301207 RepID=A0ACB6RL14_9PLEO|nr:uncharacterized protein BU25DRAFT_425656 [Macroventuria anomochaeta]KAF2622488.1 hypothetical protein BU25DRAFT_425656 [Macroventuria anomochaeta]
MSLVSNVSETEVARTRETIRAHRANSPASVQQDVGVNGRTPADIDIAPVASVAVPGPRPDVRTEAEMARTRETIRAHHANSHASARQDTEVSAPIPANFAPREAAAPVVRDRWDAAPVPHPHARPEVSQQAVHASAPRTE